MSTISRITGLTKGWLFRSRILNKSYHSKTFPDRIYGDPDESYKTAYEYAKEWSLKNLGDPYHENGEARDRYFLGKRDGSLYKSNTSGFTGIRSEIRRNPTGRSYCYWVALYTDKKRRMKKKYFSVKKYGEKLAFEKAEEFRKSWESAIDRGSKEEKRFLKEYV